MSETTLQYCSKAPKADFKRACRIHRLLRRAVSGYDPEDCVIADPITGEHKCLIIGQPQPDHRASYAAEIIMNRGFEDALARRQPGNVLRAMRKISIDNNDPSHLLFSQWFPESPKEHAAQALEIVRRAEARLGR